MLRLRNVCLVASLATLQLGCSGPPRVVFEGTSVLVPVKSWIMLEEGETVGDPNNVGCRLSYADITRIEVSLRQNEKKLGPNIKFQFRNLDVYHVRALTRTSDWGHLVSEVLLFFGYHEDAINIYYAGNYTDGGADVFGLNVDPSSAQEVFIPTGFVIVNDAGFRAGFNYNFPFNRLTLEHEVVHHLIRQFSFPYDAGEHVPNASGTANLMGPGTLVVPSVGRSPIVFQQTQTEIDNRCFAGRWNLP